MANATIAQDWTELAWSLDRHGEMLVGADDAEIRTDFDLADARLSAFHVRGFPVPDYAARLLP